MEMSAEFFKKSCPEAVTPSDGIYKRVTEYFSRPTDEVRHLAGEEIWNVIEEPGNEDLCHAAKGFICVTAFMDAVPMLDLVLTGTGFGVVSNQNIAPASAERVRALKDALALRQGALYDQLITALSLDSRWNTSETAQEVFTVMFRTCSEVSEITSNPATLQEIKRAYPEILRAQIEIGKSISDELTARLVQGTRTASLTIAEKKLKNMIRQYTTLWVRSSDRNGSNPAPHELFCAFRKAILKFVEDNIEKFPAYAGSSAYKANHFQRYENKKEDSCFFFG